MVKDGCRSSQRPPVILQTSYGAQVAPQRCPILHIRKSRSSVARTNSVYNVQFVRKDCQISAEALSNFDGSGVKRIAGEVYILNGISVMSFQSLRLNREKADSLG